MSNNDFNDGYYGTGFRNSSQWALGDQMRRIEQQKQDYYKQQTARLNAPKPTPTSYRGGKVSEADQKTVRRIAWISLAVLFSIPAIVTIAILMQGW